MQHQVAPAPVRPSFRVRRLVFIGVGVGVAAVLAALIAVLVHATFASAVDRFAPTAEDGFISENTVVTFADDDIPAIARLDPALLDAMRRAEADSSAQGLTFRVTSGWRSTQYQEWLLEDAVTKYGSEEVAREFVATPDRSNHVTGRAVDIGPIDAQFWLIEHGARFGICQIYANERWHFELATEPGGVCPEMKANAAA